ncbi:hypothetical protein TI39_contig66g00016 [Zymoseptoria brevis]|uniref:GDP/GTP exchange factor Sec2 N-terminal domain-containing protein n=1 Tax=Zymoseptoria brevis TaxID=1047168 RepID=A0A0F4H1C0_9PEZI|nr:hypothetical protein TI39_contig66g00016 [Zymoseptoria brevis]
MAYNGARYGAQVAHRHGPHDSVQSKDDITHMRLRELEEENSLLLEKVTSASQRFADYENQIRVLQQQVKHQEQRMTALSSSTVDSEQTSSDNTGLSRLGSFMRKGSFAPTATSPATTSPREQELEKSLAKEQKAREVAEQKEKQVNAEVEELSTTLFQQANEMVATERKENAALKAQIKELENAGGNVAEVVGKENERLKERLETMEQRDVEKQKRLERLEAAQKRIDRVRTMLVPR